MTVTPRNLLPGLQETARAAERRGEARPGPGGIGRSLRFPPPRSQLVSFWRLDLPWRLEELSYLETDRAPAEGKSVDD